MSVDLPGPVVVAPTMPTRELDDLSDRVWGPGNWVICLRCPDSLGLPSRHHARHHDGERR